MKISHHAKVRQQQRGIPLDIIDLILQYGTPIHKPGNAMEYRILKKDISKTLMQLKHVQKALEKASKKAVLVCENDNTIITTYHLKS